MRVALDARPERLALGAAVLSWVWMLIEAASARRISCCGPHQAVEKDIIAWLLMVVGMMVPTSTFGLRDVAARSYRVRRVRAVIEYLLGYLAWWVVLGVAFVALRQLGVAHEMRSASALCLLGAVWVLLPVRERWFQLCHRQIVLCPVGLRADLDVLRQGAMHGAPCVATCWPLMIACAITGHDLVIMIGGTVLALMEKRMVRLDRRPLVVGALALALWTLARG